MAVMLDDSILISPLAPVVSLDALMAARDRAGFPLFDIVAPSTPMEDYLDVIAAQVAVRRFVAGLPRRQRSLVVQLFWENKSQATAARDAGVSGASVSKSLHKIFDRGRRALKKHRNAVLKR
jgi:DNA-directed RNA polymerase specialized sigma24 family protein